MRRIALSSLALACLAAVTFAHLGALHPAGDTVATVAPVLALFGLAAAAMLWGRLGQGLACVFALWLAWQGWALLAPTGPAGGFAVYQKNLWYRNAQLNALAADIMASEADVVTLQEVSDRNASLLDRLARTYPHRHLCDNSRWSDIVILSRHPFVAGTARCSRTRALALVRVQAPQGPVWVASLHLSWPYPYDQAERLRQIEPLLASMQGPAVVGGDLNMFPATRVSRQVARLTGTRELRPLRPTLWLRGLPMLIDHVYARGGTVERRPLLGSDHFGLLGRVTP